MMGEYLLVNGFGPRMYEDLLVHRTIGQPKAHLLEVHHVSGLLLLLDLITEQQMVQVKGSHIWLILGRWVAVAGLVIQPKINGA